MKTLHSLATEDTRINLIVGDLGFGVVEEFAAAFPDRFWNAGVAEQNMTGIATGLALAGEVAFTYSIANFPTLRCLEQIRNDAAYHRANVKVVAVGGGLAYGALGVSHHATEDLAVLRVIPELAVVAPGDPVEAAAATRAVAQMEGPVYLRLGKAGEPSVHKSPLDQLTPGRALTLRAGNDVAIFACGGLLDAAAVAADRLSTSGVSTRLVSTPWLWPFDAAAVISAGFECRLVVTVEEHSKIGGLGGAVAEVLAEMQGAAPLLRIGLPRSFTSRVGDQDYLRRYYGLDAESIVAKIVDRLEAGNVRV